MKRVFIFLVLGPLAVAITVFSALAAGGAPGNFAQFLAAALAFLTFPVAAFAGLADGCLARTFPIPLRAPLTAIIGATIACIPAFAFLHCFLPSSELMFLPVGGAVCMGLCSLLSHDYRGGQGPSLQSA
jgi:hypothetical protein